MSPIPERLEDYNKELHGEFKADIDSVSRLSGSVADSYANMFENYLPDRRFRRQIAISVKL